MYIFIVNPMAGSGKGKKVWDKVRRQLIKLDIPFRSFNTQGPGHATELAKQVSELYRDKIRAVIAIGGDGTVHEVINGLVNYPHIPFSAISAGSGNDFARGFGLSRRPLAALNRILKSEHQAHLYAKQFPGGELPSEGYPAFYDLGVYQFSAKKIDQGHFINGLGIGFDGEVAQLTNRARYKKWLNKVKLGGLAYVISALKLLYRYETKSVRLRIDHQELHFDQVWLIAICNIPYYGGGMKIVPNARPNDGLLHLCVVHKLKPWQVLLALASVYLGWHTRLQTVHLLKGKEIRLESGEPMTVHADGEVIGRSPLDIRLNQKSRLIY